VLLAAALVPAAAAAAPPPSLMMRARADELAAARATWARQHLVTYSYRVSVSCFCAPSRPTLVTVHGGRPVRTPAGFRDVDTVAKLFALVQAHLRDDELSVRYDPTRGVPLVISSNPKHLVADDEVTYTVRGFRPLPPAGRNG
jgi:hypothetical protein